jgi:hypothetical protein
MAYPCPIGRQVGRVSNHFFISMIQVGRSKASNDIKRLVHDEVVVHLSPRNKLKGLELLVC